MKQEQFVHPYQVNFIRKQLKTLIGAFYFSGDSRVLEASRANVMSNIWSQFSGLTPDQRALIDEAAAVRDKDELNRYMHTLAPFVIPFPPITAAEIRKLFPKVKKLMLPDLSLLEPDKLTYLGWRDIASNSLYMVHQVNGKWKGIECRYVLGQKGRAYQCMWCHQSRSGDEISLVTSQVKTRDVFGGYKTMGNHLCLNSDACNAHLSSKTEIETFLAMLK